MDIEECSKIPTGSSVIDRLLGGGFERGTVTTVYGPSSSGKTNICILTLIRVVGTGKKIIYIDTESSFSVERLCQITKYSNKVLPKIIFFHPETFEEQHNIIQRLPEIAKDNIGLVVVDTISMLYRLEMAQATNVQPINSALAKQLVLLIKTARKCDIPIIVTNQVYADFNEKDSVKMVGGDILKNGSRCIIELQKLNGKRRAYLRKHRSLPERYVDFKIIEKGIS